MPRTRCWGWVALALGSAACSDSSAPSTPKAIVLTPVDSDYDFSLFVTAPPGDPTRLLVVERGGRIRLRKNGVLQDSAFLNLTALTNPSTGEYGVYSIAFHPQYATNRRFFVYYADLNGNSQLAEYLADPSFDHGDPNSAQPVLSQTQLAPNVLYGGLITFGPDGKLYLGLGDALEGGIDSLSQDSTDLRGKILRLDVDGTRPYAIPADNPYVNRPGWRPEIWQLGLRNPWRWSFDRLTGEVWIGDVGEHLWEEIDYLPAAAGGGGGNNFGWPIAEGNHCFPPASACDATGLVAPVLEYPHDPSCSVIGGYVYRGRRFPRLDGVYFYGDYCGGWVRSLRRMGDTVVTALPAVASPLLNDNVVSFGEDAEGEVYVVMASGRIYRIEAVP